jgi:uncharacterized membrane-anchored protein YitT (DUF2179 family)
MRSPAIPLPVRPAPPLHRRALDDLQALVTGTLFVSVGLVLFKQAGLLLGGTAGLALLAHYAAGLDFSVAFFCVNLPFYLLAWLRMGPRFTAKTVLSVALVSLFAHFLPQWLAIQQIAVPLAAVLGGLLCGAGMLMLFRHEASLGGFNVLVLYLQERFGWRAGKVQMVLDAGIVAIALAVADPARVLWSVLGVVMLNLAIAVNHRPGRAAEQPA